MVQIEELKLHPKNPNKHPASQIERLAQILEYQGWRYPVKVSLLSGFVTSGHGRIEAAKKNGWREVPVNYQEYESEEQEYADLVSDNAIAEWAELDLSSINSEVGDLGPDFDVNLLGIEDFVIEPAEKYDEEKDDQVPEEPKEPRTKLGDIYEIGAHRVMCGDATKDIGILLGHSTNVCMTLTSPPYCFGNHGFDEGKYIDKSKDNDINEWFSMMGLFTKECLARSKYVFVNIMCIAGNKKRYFEYVHAHIDHFVDFMTWKKPHMPVLEKKILAADFENIFIFSNEINPKKHIKLSKDHHSVSNVIEVNRSNSKHGHRASFVVDMPVKIIESFGPKTVMDPFGGSGTTLIACEKTGRKSYMMELEPKYVDVIVQRWCDYTGNTMVKLNGKEIEWHAQS